jgi:hypothetical protein
MKQPVSQSTTNGTRKRTRSNEDTLIADLQAKIARLRRNETTRSISGGSNGDRHAVSWRFTIWIAVNNFDELGA